jgi:hypothetical protein
VGRAPEDVADDDDLQFSLEQEAAHNQQINNRLIEGRAARLTAAGAFRVQVGNNDFERAYHPKFGDKVHAVGRVEHGGRVFDADGREFPTKHVLPVAAGTEEAHTAGLGPGSAQKEERERAAIEPFRAQILAHVGTGKYLHEMARYMDLIGLKPILKHGLNYKKVLLLLGLDIDARTRVTRPAAAAPAAPAAAPAAARLRLNFKQAAPLILPPAAASRLRLHGKQAVSTAAA